MHRRTLNLGVVAHVDAGKTSLTERLLFDHGAVPQLGSVDAGTTRTDSDELERERGITIRAAVAAFDAGDQQINLVDTPGHPDFIAEVQRSLAVLDGAVLVLSAVEGVQAQTRVLMRALQAMRLPTVLFVNKVDRSGARPDEVVADVRRKLTPVAVALGSVSGAGSRDARVAPFDLNSPSVVEQVGEIDDEILECVIAGEPPGAARMRSRLAALTAARQIHPLLFGSALTGEGVGALVDAVRWLITSPTGAAPTEAAASDEPAGIAFAIERASNGEKVAYVRLFGGELRPRQRVTFRRQMPDGSVTLVPAKITALDVVATTPGIHLARAGDIARIRGVAELAVGDQLGQPPRVSPSLFTPALESVARPARGASDAQVHSALTLLAEEDPLVRTRRAPGGGTSVLLFGDVQQQVIAERLRRRFATEVVFQPAQPLYVERVVSIGEAMIEIDPRGGTLFWATVGLRVEPMQGDAVVIDRQSEWGVMPRAFHAAIDDAVRQSLQQGIHGWEVTGCRVTVLHARQLAPMSTAADFRHLTPIVLQRALEAAGCVVCEPCRAVEIAVPDDCLTLVTGQLASMAVAITDTRHGDDESTICGTLPARLIGEFARALPRLTRGEGAFWSEPAPPRPVRGNPPHRPRTDGNPLQIDEYLRFLATRNQTVAQR